MPLIEFDGDSGAAPQDYWELPTDGSLGNWELSEIRTNWTKLLGNNGISVGSKQNFRIEAREYGGKGRMKVIIGGYFTEKSYDHFMQGHKYLRILCWPELESPIDPEDPDDEEISRRVELIIYQGEHDIADSNDIKDLRMFLMSPSYMFGEMC